VIEKGMIRSLRDTEEHTRYIGRLQEASTIGQVFDVFIDAMEGGVVNQEVYAVTEYDEKTGKPSKAEWRPEIHLGKYWDQIAIFSGHCNSKDIPEKPRKVLLGMLEPDTAFARRGYVFFPEYFSYNGGMALVGFRIVKAKEL